MIHNEAKHGYWGVSINSDGDGLIVLVGDGIDGDQAKAVLTTKQAKVMITALQDRVSLMDSKERELLDKPSDTKKCKYCDNPAVKTLVWLKDKSGNSARIMLPWCGCDLMTALCKIWTFPSPVVEGDDYEILPIEELSKITITIEGDDLTKEQVRDIFKNVVRNAAAAEG